MNRVVITGMGTVCPIGNNVEEAWQGIRDGVCGIDTITKYDPSQEKCKVGAEVKDFVYPDKRAGKRLDLSSQYAIVAGREALDQAGIVSGENVDPDRFGIYVGSGIGGIMTLEGQIKKAALKDSTKHVSALMIPMTIVNLVGGNMAIEFQAKGPCIGMVTACATGTHSIGEAVKEIRHGYADVMLAGGTEAAFAKITCSGFGNMTATTTRTEPLRASTPFDKERDGFVMGEGAGILVLESLEHAEARGAEILGEIVGYGSTCDAYHITAPAPGGEGAAKAMEMALKEADIDPEKIDYINAHGTGTPMNDLCETQAVKSVFGDDTKVPMSSTKGNIGHLLGGAGGVEAVFSMKAILDGFIPPTIGYKVPDEELDLDYVPNEGRDAELIYTMSNSLGFGGHNGTLIFKKYEK
jgi:3-oxoacyl-[acyl-carrier-protein] synthase II